MMFTLDMMLLLAAVALLIPIGVLFIECGAALLPRLPATRQQIIEPRPKVAVLIPAHNEAPGLRATLESLLPQITKRDQVIVVADNCIDDTASIARNIDGVTVIERNDPHRQGKGYALDFGLSVLKTAPPDVVIMIDADCKVHPNTIYTLSRRAVTLGRPVQAIYISQPPLRPKTNDLISALAFKVKNLVRPQGLARLGLPCLLTGSGMAFPWRVISKAGLATGDITEDMRLSVELALAGHPPAFCAQAMVTSILPASMQAAKNQRTRWEHGHLKTVLSEGLRLFTGAIKQRSFYLLALLLELAVPPLALLVTVWGIFTAVTGLAAAMGGSPVPLMVLCFAGVLMVVAIASAWAKYGRDLMPVTVLLKVPAYILWKVPIYLIFLVRAQNQWVRTPRDIPIEIDDMEGV
ncbi:MAG: glycosyltransferase [Anaerolineae bacterium]|nr:glycosyltransferase [Anaerolineae bacterium]